MCVCVYVCVYIYNSNLHLFQEKSYSRENEVGKMDKLITFVREPLLDEEAAPAHSA